jgi:hypothetical protein
VLNAKSEIDIQLNVTFTEKSLGQQRISIIVDSGNVVAESNEADNVAFRDITVVVATVAGATTVVPTTQAPPTAITEPATIPPTTAVPTTAVATTAVPPTTQAATQPATQPGVVTATLAQTPVATTPATQPATQAPTETATLQPTTQLTEPPTVAATQPATQPPPTEVAAAPTFTPTLCPQPTPELLQVEPVTSPTTEFSQVVVVRIGNGDQVSITTESGTFQAVGDFSVNQPAQVMITLLPNTTHNLPRIQIGTASRW